MNKIRALWLDRMNTNSNTYEERLKKRKAGHHLCSLTVNSILYDRLALLSSGKSAILKGLLIECTERSMNWPEKYILTHSVKYLAH